MTRKEKIISGISLLGLLSEDLRAVTILFIIVFKAIRIEQDVLKKVQEFEIVSGNIDESKYEIPSVPPLINKSYQGSRLSA